MQQDAPQTTHHVPALVLGACALANSLAISVNNGLLKHRGCRLQHAGCLTSYSRHSVTTIPSIAELTPASYPHPTAKHPAVQTHPLCLDGSITVTLASYKQNTDHSQHPRHKLAAAGAIHAADCCMEHARNGCIETACHCCMETACTCCRSPSCILLGCWLCCCCCLLLLLHLCLAQLIRQCICVLSSAVSSHCGRAVDEGGVGLSCCLKALLELLRLCRVQQQDGSVQSNVRASAC